LRGIPIPRLPRDLSGQTRLGAKNSIGPVRVNLDLPMIPSFVVSAAGVLAAVDAIDTTAVSQFATRFGATFKEYAIVGARLRLKHVPQGVACMGSVYAFLDEKSAAAPTFSVTADRPRVEIQTISTASNAFVGPDTVKTYEIDWMAADLDDEDWNPIATNYTPLWLKLYSDTGNLLSSGAATIFITGTLAFVFRGLQ